MEQNHSMASIAQLISRNRSALMGVAIIWVILYHIKIHTGFFPIDVVCRTGFAGVDIFLFASGFGLFLSLDHNPNLRRFYTRRMQRILPTYWTVLGLLAIVGYTFSVDSLCDPLKALPAMLGISFWMGENGGYSYWYAALIIAFYLIYPILHTCIKRNAVTTIICTFLLSLLGSIFFYYLYCNYGGQDTWVQIFAITRLPIFTLGAILAYYSQQPIILSRIHCRSLVVLAIIGLTAFCIMPYLFNDSLLKKGGLYFLPPLLFTPTLCYWLAMLFEKSPACIKKILESLGSISFELYLIHVAIFDIFLFSPTSWPRYTYVLLLVAISLSLAYLLRYIINTITSPTTSNRP